MTTSKTPVNPKNPTQEQSNEDTIFFDEILPSVAIPSARASLKADILAGFDEERSSIQSNTKGIWSFFDFIFNTPSIQRGALAGAGFLGLAVGIVAPTTSAGLLPEDEIYMYSEETTSVYGLADEEYNQWIGE